MFNIITRSVIQYKEDDAASSNPIGNSLLLVRADTPAAVTDTNGDNIATRGTNKGELYVKHIDAIPVTDNDGALTVDGAVLDTIDAVLDTIDAVLDTINAKLVTGTVIGDVNLGATDNAVLDDIAAKLGTIDADTGNIATAVQLIDNAISGSEMQVDVVAALPTGSNAIGKLAANSGVDIGDVDVTSVTPGTAAANLGKAEDAAHSSGDVGVMVLGIRDDTLSICSGAENDYEPFHMTAAGRLYASATIDAALPAGDNNIGNMDVASIAAGDNNIGNVDIVTMPGTGVEDAAETAGGTLLMAGTVRRDTAASSAGASGDNATLNTDANGRVWTNGIVQGTVADDVVTPGNPVMIGGKAVSTDGTDPTSVAEGDAAILRTTPDRRLLVSDVSPRLGSALQEETSAQTNHEVVAAPGASLSLYITDIVVSNDATAGYVVFYEDTAGTPVQKTGKLYLAINGGAVMNFRTPIRITANKNFGFTSNTVTTHSVMVNYYIAP